MLLFSWAVKPKNAYIPSSLCHCISCMAEWCRGLLQDQSKVLELTELGDACEWVVMVVKKLRREQVDDSSAILEMMDEEGATHPDEF